MEPLTNDEEAWARDALSDPAPRRFALTLYAVALAIGFSPLLVWIVRDWMGAR